ncbi:MAG TPA: ATP-binding protein [Bacillaceae bacterium]
MNQHKGDVISFLSERKDRVFHRWKQKIMYPSDEQELSKIDANGDFLFTTFLNAFSLEPEEREKFIQEKAHNAASVKIKQKSSLGLFVYNVNAAKNEILAELEEYPAPKTLLPSLKSKVNGIIDLFLYHSVSHFSLLKDQIIDEKNRRINAVHEDRLTLLGQMTSSFVHEFRNPLTAVHGFIQLLRAEDPKLPYLDIISGELDQLKYRITQFLMLSKKELLEREETTFSFNELLEQITSFLYPRLLEVNVSLQHNMEDQLYIKGIQEEVRQVMINIIFNAIEVMALQENKSIILIEGYQKDGMVYLKTSNTGPKIPETLLKNIFEPFVTTKKTGTGLGLFVSKEIIEKHGGQLLCESDDNWTTFTIILPAANPTMD